jgi:hypothetical protein
VSLTDPQNNTPTLLAKLDELKKKFKKVFLGHSRSDIQAKTERPMNILGTMLNLN